CRSLQALPGRRRGPGAVRGTARRHGRGAARFDRSYPRSSLPLESRGTHRLGPVVGLRARPVLDRARPAPVTTIGPLLAIAALTAQSPAADTLRLLATHLPDSELAAAVRARPFAVRDAVTDALRQVVKGPTAS